MNSATVASFSFCVFLIQALVTVTGSTFAEEIPPNGELRVAYRQRVDGKLSDSVHELILTCHEGQCELMTLTLNQCWEEGSFPKIQRNSTTDGDLTVTVVTNGLLIAKVRDQGLLDDTEFTYKFSYAVKTDEGRSRLSGSRTDKRFSELRDFSGGAVKDSVILHKVITWDCVPLRGRNPAVECRCKIILDGVPETKE